MDDLISRQAAIEETWKEPSYTDPLNVLAELRDRIKDLPSAHPLDPCETCLHKGKGWDEDPCDGCTGTESKYKPDNGWIPVSERLPEKYGQYLVTFIPSGGTLWTCVLIARYSDLMGIAKPSFHVGTVGKNDFMNITEQVTAWMPLPDPYKEGDA